MVSEVVQSILSQREELMPDYDALCNDWIKN